MMDYPNYVRGHEWKMKWYADNGFVEGENLFVTKESSESGIDSSAFEKVIDQIREAV